jgi:AraC-like DNA-binding protein
VPVGYSRRLDTLSEVLRAIRLTGAVYFTIDGSAPWVVETPPGAVIAPHIGAGVEHVINYHVITSGGCWAGLVGEPPFRVEAGDIVAFPQGDPHVLSSEPGMRARADADVYETANRQSVPLCLSLGGGGAAGAGLVCGFLGCDARPFNPLLAALPRVIHLPAAREGTAAARRLIDLALAESTVPRAGSAGVLSRLSEVLLVEVVRFLTTDRPNDPAPDAATDVAAGRTGWFAGLEDAIVGPALNNLHQRPTTIWTLARLAKEVGTSRSVLAERFTRLVGMPPMQYLARWRMQMAATLLRTTTAGLAEIAERVGYGSEAALSRAFKRSLGVAPAYYRRDPAADPRDPDARPRDRDARSF